MPEATEMNTVTKSLVLKLPVYNPVPVLDSRGALLGSAIVDIVDGGLRVFMTVDKNRPEGFDLEMDAKNVSVQVRGSFDHQALSLTLVVDM